MIKITKQDVEDFEFRSLLNSIKVGETVPDITVGETTLDITVGEATDDVDILIIE